MQGKLLLVSTNRKSREILPDALRRELPEAAVDVASRAAEAVERVAGEAYDVVVCCADSADELGLLIRLKKRAPDLPVIVLSRVPDAGFETLARSKGAERVVRKVRGLEDTSRALAQAIRTGLLAGRMNREAARSKDLAREVRRLAVENRGLVSMALGLAAAEEAHFTTMLVEDDPLQMTYLVSLLARAKLPPFVRTVSTADEAVAYLSGKGRYADRVAYPMPALIVSDLHLPGSDGLSLLRWVRTTAATRHLGFVMLTSSERDSDIEAAFEGGADLYLVKSERLEDVVDVVRNVYLRYMAERTGARPS